MVSRCCKCTEKPYEKPEPIVTKANAPVDQNDLNDQADQVDLNDQNDHPIIETFILSKEDTLASKCRFSVYHWNLLIYLIYCSLAPKKDDFLFEEEPKKVSEVLKHPGWVHVMQEELNQFTRNNVWTLVPPLNTP
ncbi:hypothetical protein Tco_1029867 [Tanacetum coccineum]|uniref:Uncharacterized protein n=1 Tax=Tanacetum coccineum TaxID=301880 RepID=A0ABQ5G4W6_9ASTR